jgi:molybdopterin-guanine dinucleotide biosynthesis protein A/SAM-dependent methyltransferase
VSVLGAVLAGGRGSRLGGRKATAELAGRPLLDWTVELVGSVCDEVVVVAKPDTPLPPTRVDVWRSEPADFHPRHGLVSALRGARGRPVLVVPCDMPLVPTALLETLIAMVEDGSAAAIPETGGHLQPLCAAYGPQALLELEAAPEDEPLKRTLDRLEPAVIQADGVGDLMLNINHPADLERAEQLLDLRIDLSAAWDRAAEDWIRWARAEDHDHVFWRFVRPALLGLLPGEPGRLTLDVGCGEGRLARELQGVGHRVLGIEPSPRLAAAAREADPPTQVLVADAASLPLDDGVVDLAVSTMSLLNIARLDQAIAEIGRVLSPDGCFCFVTAHPYATFASARRLLGGDRSYFGEAVFTERRERSGLAMQFTDAHRPLSALTGALERAGLVLETLREPTPDAAYVAAHPEVAEWRARPALLAGRAAKRGR